MDTTNPSVINIPETGVLVRTDYLTYIPTVVGDLPGNNSTQSPSPSPSKTPQSNQQSNQSQDSSSSSSDDDDPYGGIGYIPTKLSISEKEQLDLSYGFVSKIQASTYRLQTKDVELLIHCRYLLDKYDDTIGTAPNKIASYIQVVLIFQIQFVKMVMVYLVIVKNKV